MADIKPYTIAIDEERLDDLKTRLSLAKFPDELDEAGWDSKCLYFRVVDQLILYPPFGFYNS